MGGAQIITRLSRLCTTVVLSRMLDPKDFGMAAIVLTVYECVSLFSRNGIAAAVVQAEESQSKAVAQAAWALTWIVCASLSLIQIAIAIPVALAYHNVKLALPIALMGVIYLAGPFSTIQFAFLQREGRLGRIAMVGTAQVVVDNLLTAVFAALGFGMWAIVLPKILVAPIWLFFIRYGHDWRPAPLKTLALPPGWRDILRFSRHVVGVELLTTVQANLDNLIVGYCLGLHALGVYYFAFNAGLGVTLGLVNAFGIAVYPHLCQARGDQTLLARRFREARRTLGLITVPLVLLQVAMAPLYVPIVFGDKWTPAIPVLMMICLSAIARPFANTTSSLLRALGRPDVELRWQLALTVFLIAGLLLGSRAGILGVAIAVFVVQTLVLGVYSLVAPRPFVGPVPAKPSLTRRRPVEDHPDAPPTSTLAQQL